MLKLHQLEIDRLPNTCITIFENEGVIGFI